MDEKQCTKCKETKLLNAFYCTVRNKSGRTSWCKQCSSSYTRKRYAASKRVRQQHVQDARKWYVTNKQKALKRSRESKLKRHGLTIRTYEKLSHEQAGLCAICRRPESHNNGTTPLCVDHCHQSGRMRALLCHKCNTMLGMAEDNPKTLIRAAEYLKCH